jgi:4-amino-4-deoxy-L-arabinose transferase-like glycosyltransferase
VRGRNEAGWRWPVDAVLGGAVVAIVLLAAGTVGALHPAVVLGLTAALALASHREVVAAVREIPALLPRGVAGIAVSLLFVLLLAAAVAPATEWDSLMYHLRIPLWFLEEGRIALPRDSFHVALVGSAHLATLPLLAAGLSTGPALMQVAALALTLAGTVALARAAGVSRGGGWLSVAVVLGCPAFVLVAITARVDVMLVLALVAAHLALLEAAEEGDRATLTIAALLVGIAVAIKPHAGAYAIALVPLGWRAARGVRPALVAALVAIAVALPWYVKNQVLVGAPLYPVGAPGWFEPWLAEIFGTVARPGTVDASILRALPDARTSFNVLDAFFAPDALTIEGEGAFYALSPVLLLLPLVLLALRSHPRAIGLAGVGVVYALLVVLPFGQINLRYLMPAVPALAVATVLAVEAASARLGTRLGVPMRRVLGAALVVVALLPLTGALRQRFLGGDAVLLRHAVGAASAQEVWRRHPDGTARSYAPVIGNVHALVPAQGRVLMLWEARALPLERDVLADVMLSNWSFLAQSAAPSRCLAGTGITHVLIGGGAAEYYVARGADPRAFRIPELTAFRERCLVNHRTVGPGFEFFEVRR